MKLDGIGSLIQLAVSMNPLQRALIEKAGHDNGFEYVLPGDAQHVALASARPSDRPHSSTGTRNSATSARLIKPAFDSKALISTP